MQSFKNCEHPAGSAIWPAHNAKDGCAVGVRVVGDEDEGALVGTRVGARVGERVGDLLVGESVGAAEGAPVAGAPVGALVGAVGEGVGTCVVGGATTVAPGAGQTGIAWHVNDAPDESP